MAAIQKYTSTPFINSGAIPTGNVSNQIYSVLSSSAFDRRIYGIGVSLNDGTTHTQVRFYINNGSSNFQINYNSITANSGFTTSQGLYELFGASTIFSCFSKQYDQIGQPYFNLPAGWSFGASSFLSMGGASNEMRFWFVGETYNTNNLTLTGDEYTQEVEFLNADSTNTKTIVSSSAFHRRLYGISCFSSDATARNLTLKLNDGTNSRTIGTISVTANSGNSTTISALDILSHPNTAPVLNKQTDISGQPFFHLPAGWSIEGNFAVAITAGAKITFSTTGETYE